MDQGLFTRPRSRWAITVLGAVTVALAALTPALTFTVDMPPEMGGLLRGATAVAAVSLLVAAVAYGLLERIRDEHRATRAGCHAGCQETTAALGALAAEVEQLGSKVGTVLWLLNREPAPGKPAPTYQQIYFDALKDLADIGRTEDPED